MDSTTSAPRVRRTTVFIQTAIEVEYRAVRAHLTGPTEEFEERGSQYTVGVFEGARGPVHVTTQLAGPGQETAATQLDRAVGLLSPRIVLLVGVAGGRKDVALGDVVAADAVYGYEAGRDEEQRMLPRVRTWHSSFGLVQRARVTAADGAWRALAGPPAGPSANAFVGALATGAKLVAHNRSATAELISRTAGDALAVEMEALGFLVAAHANLGVEAMVIRGVSDLLSDKTGSHDERWQPIAARHAAAFAFGLLSEHPGAVSPGDGSSGRSQSSPDAGPPGRPRPVPREPSLAALGALADVLLRIPGIQSPRAWQLLLDSVPGAGVVTGRQDNARLEALSLLRVCASLDGWAALQEALCTLWPGVAAVEAFAELLREYGFAEPGTL